MPQIMSDGGVRHYFKIRGRDYPVEMSSKDKLNKEDFQHIAATLYTALHERDILLTEVQPFRGQYMPVAACLKQLLFRDKAIIEGLIKQHVQRRNTDVFTKLASIWRQHGKNEQRGLETLIEFKRVIYRSGDTELIQKLNSCGERWQRLMLVWMLTTSLNEKPQPNHPYLKMIERYLRGDFSGWYDANWWEVPAYVYTRTQWELMGYEPNTHPTLRYAPTYNQPNIVYTYWQVTPIKGKADVRQAFLIDQVMQTIPAIAAAFVAAYPPLANQSDYDALIYDMACVLSGEYGHEYYDLWDQPVTLAVGSNVVKMDFAQAVYRLCGWDFSAYPYYEFQ